MVKVRFRNEQSATQRMVNHPISTTYPNAIDVVEDYDMERGSRDHNEAGSFTSRKNRSWNESDPIIGAESSFFRCFYVIM